MTAPDNSSTGTRPRDASMSLLNNLFQQPLEPGYAEAARRRRERGEDPGSNRASPIVLLAGGLALGVLFAFGLAQAEGTASIASAEREGLIERINSEESHTERLRETVDELQTEISELEDVALRGTARGQRVRDELQLLTQAAGTSAVSGPGVSVILNDAEDPSVAERPEVARVLDVDLQNVVNGLWLAGAEAISINGQRLTALSAIRMAENIIYVHHQALRPPYRVEAIGDSRTLPQKFIDGPGGEFLRGAASHGGIQYEVNTVESLTLPAASPEVRYARHARQTEEAS